MDVLVLKGFEEALQLVRRLGVVGLARASAESACVRHRGVWRRPRTSAGAQYGAGPGGAKKGGAAGDSPRTLRGCQSAASLDVDRRAVRLLSAPVVRWVCAAAGL